MRTKLVTGLALLGGCIFESDQGRLNIQAQFEIVEPDPTAEPRVLRGVTAIQVDHRFQTPTECVNFTAKAEQKVAVIEVTLGIEDLTGSNCPASVTEWRYSAVITGIQGPVNRVGVTRTGGLNPGRDEYPIPDEITPPDDL